MDHEVSVVLKSGDRFDFPLGADELAAFDPAGARHWIADANFKPADYHPATADVRRFLCAALRAMGRTTLTIDLVAYKL